MYTHEQASQTIHQFWISFGKYMAPLLSAEGEKVNWVNYKTGIRDVYFRLDVTRNEASIAIEILHKEPGRGAKIFNQFVLLKNILEERTGLSWQLEPLYINEQQQVLSRISRRQGAVSIYDKNQWPAIISFLKPGMVSLDAFWCECKIVFEMLD
jgi:hypothetical protein